ncbi:MAG TPA: hypothetical protein P5279_16145, partial [Anaerohalosphaeraceae bacterium]|nr:hypothetical protein [Anaerohalosphaeraceae bacterium]HRT52020.1 hypothetical protein [Anaerohalosphaeraceae bacterium]HRT88083.1 hypothetical protein [Anaerohalosphaeraceae bacterium]
RLSRLKEQKETYSASPNCSFGITQTPQQGSGFEDTPGPPYPRAVSCPHHHTALLPAEQIAAYPQTWGW